MIITKTTEYSIRILSFMSLSNDKLITAKFLQKHLKIPPRYLFRLLTSLTKSGFIESKQGRNGGYVFLKSLDEIFVSDIIDAVEGKNPFNDCILGLHECMFEKPCSMHHVWADAKKSVIKVLKNTTLADFRKEQGYE